MGWFWKRQAPPPSNNDVASLRSRVDELERVARALEDDWVEFHKKWIKARRTAAAERTNQERQDESEAAPVVSSETPSVPRWGARSRWGGGNGVHP